MPQDDFHGNPQQNAYEMLKRLYRNSRASVANLVAQRTMSSFSLQAEAYPPEVESLVSVAVYPQNPFISEPEIRKMSATDIQAGLINSRIQIQDSLGLLAQADEEGNYIYWSNTPEFDQVNAFYYATLTLRMFERYAHRSIPWAFPAPRLLVNPRVGNLANAFYDEQNHLVGFHTFHTRNGASHSTAQSADIVAHETAHAVLDGLRDLQNESLGLGTRAFHESFGDMAAILVALHDSSLIRRLLDISQNNLRSSNFVSQIAEFIAQEMQANPEHVDEHTIYLRNAFNQLKNLPFDNLPVTAKNPINELSQQEHNYSRLFTGAFYDILVGIYEQLVAEKQPYFIALYRARDLLGHLLVMAIEVSPLGELNFADMARAFLTAESVLYQGNYRLILEQVFSERLLLSTESAQEYLHSLANLPSLTLPPMMNNSLAAFRFLEDEIVPNFKQLEAVKLMPLAAYRNAAGYAFVNYFSAQTATLIGAEFKYFEQAEIELFGGLCLMFDKENHLRSFCYRPVTEEDIRQTKIILAELIQTGRIARDLPATNQRIRPLPQALHIPQEEIASRADKIVRYPVIYDEISKDIPLETYLQAVQE